MSNGQGVDRDGREWGTQPCPPCGCAGTTAIMIRLSETCCATLHSCPRCGAAWDINGAPAGRGEVHALIPRSRSPLAIWRVGGSVRPVRPRRSAEPPPEAHPRNDSASTA
jgi:hypothetical protein